MNQVFSRIVEAGAIPNRQDIADLLAAIAPTGEQRELKDSTVKDLFDELGQSHVNTQGHSVLDELASWGEY